MSRLSALFVALTLAVAATACEDIDNTTTNPTGDNRAIDLYPVPLSDGTLPQLTRGGGITSQFTTSASGQIDAQITSVAPDAAVVLGIALGVYDPTTQACQLILTNDSSGLTGVALSGIASSAGTFCVRVYDVGYIPADQPVTYVVRVIHP